MLSRPTNSLLSFLFNKNKTGNPRNISSVLKSFSADPDSKSSSKASPLCVDLAIFSIMGLPEASSSRREYRSSITSLTSANLASSDPSIMNTTPWHWEKYLVHIFLRLFCPPRSQKRKSPYGRLILAILSPTVGVILSVNLSPSYFFICSNKVVLPALSHPTIRILYSFFFVYIS